MNALHQERMRTLIAFLRTLRPEQFDFSSVRREHACGTVGCAIGWSPEVFPELVGKPEADDPGSFKWLPTGGMCGYDRIGALLFGLSSFDAVCLFTPESQHGLSELLADVPPYARPEEVADMLEHFLALVQAGRLIEVGIGPAVDALAGPVESGVPS